MEGVQVVDYFEDCKAFPLGDFVACKMPLDSSYRIEERSPEGVGTRLPSNSYRGSWEEVRNRVYAMNHGEPWTREGAQKRMKKGKWNASEEWTELCEVCRGGGCSACSHTGYEV